MLDQGELESDDSIAIEKAKELLGIRSGKISPNELMRKKAVEIAFARLLIHLGDYTDEAFLMGLSKLKEAISWFKISAEINHKDN